jgi:DDE superfamily endonuclease
VADAEDVWRREDVLQPDLRAYDPRSPVVCFDDACKPWFGEVRPAQPARPGRPARIDSEYERKGVCPQLLMCDPLRGGRHVKVTARRSRRDYAECVRDLVDRPYPQARQIRLGQDNLTTPDGARLYEAFAPAEARRRLNKSEFHYTPKHGRWLNRAETELNLMNSQCLDRRLDNQPLIAAEVAAWEKKRHLAKARIHWTFPLAAARRKLRKLYPSIEV